MCQFLIFCSFQENERFADDDDLSEGKQVIVGICAMSKKSQSKPMKEILTRLEEFEYLKTIVFPEDVILNVRISTILFYHIAIYNV